MTTEEFKQLYMQNKEYIGDSVYIHFDGYHFVLETRNGLPNDPSNIICLDGDVLVKLLQYKEKLFKAYDSVLTNENKD